MRSTFYAFNLLCIIFVAVLFFFPLVFNDSGDLVNVASSSLYTPTLGALNVDSLLERFGVDGIYNIYKYYKKYYK